MRHLCVFLVCLTLASTLAVSPFHESPTPLEDAADDQLAALFDDSARQDEDLGEDVSVPQHSSGPQELSALAVDGKRHVSYQFQQAVNAAKKMGEDAPELQLATGPEAKARDMIELGNLLQTISGKGDVGRSHAVTSLNQALQTKLLMDELKPGDGSFARALKEAEKQKREKSLGEQKEKPEPLSHFSELLESKNKDMMAITRYLLMRKKEGRPLTAKEDDQLQNFYYSRASGILKKILLLKHGDEKKLPVLPDSVSQPTVTHEEDQAAKEVQSARNHAAASWSVFNSMPKSLSQMQHLIRKCSNPGSVV
jgi:hypothetical protein